MNSPFSDATLNAAQPKPRRRWYQYGLRTLLTVVTVAGCGFGWLGIKVREVRHRQAVVAAIKKLGGGVAYDFEWHTPKYGTPRPPGPAWLREFLGQDFFASVYHVCLTGTAANDADLERLSCFDELTLLNLGGTKVTDVGLEKLAGLTHLQMLTLDNTRITDAGLKHLESLTQLTSLDLSRTTITDVGLERLKGLTKLEALYLSGVQIDDAGLGNLKDLSMLSEVWLFDTAVTENGAWRLQEALQTCGVHSNGDR